MGVEGAGKRPVRIRQMSTSLRRKSSRSMSARVVAPRVCGSPVLLVIPACRHVIYSSDDAHFLNPHENSHCLAPIGQRMSNVC